MSTTAIPDLWPEDIRVDVIDPVAILRAQEVGLTKKTQGLLRAEVRSFENRDENQKRAPILTHSLDLIAPALKEYRVTLLKALHTVDLIYPVTVHSRVFDPDFRPSGVNVPIVGGIGGYQSAAMAALASAIGQPAKPDPEYRQAATQDEFIKLVTEVLQSAWVRSLIHSLISRSNAVGHDQNGSQNPNGSSTERSGS